MNWLDKKNTTQSKLKKQQAELKDYNQQAVNLEDSLESARANKIIQEESLASKQELIKEQKAAIENFQLEFEALTEQKEVDDLKMNTISLVANKNKRVLSELEKNIFNANHQANIVKTKIEDLESSINISKSSINEKTSEYETLINDIEFKNKQEDNYAIEKKKLVEESKDLDGKINNLNTKLVEEKRIVDQYESEVSAQKEKASNSGILLEDLFCQLLEKQKKHQSLKKHHEVHAKNINRHDQEIEKTTTELNQINKKISQLQKMVDNQEKSISSKESITSQQNHDIDVLNNLLDQHENTFKSNSSQVIQLEVQLEDQFRSISDLKHKNSDYESKNEIQKEEIQSLEQEVDAKNEIIKNSQQLLNELTAEVSTQTVIINTLQSATLEANNKKSNLLRDIAAAEDKGDTFIQDQARLQKEHDHINKTIHYKTTQHDELVSGNKSLKENVDELKDQIKKSLQSTQEKEHLLLTQNEFHQQLMDEEIKLNKELSTCNKESEQQINNINNLQIVISQTDKNIESLHSDLRQNKEKLANSLNKERKLDSDIISRLSTIFKNNEVNIIIKEQAMEFIASLKGNIKEQKAVQQDQIRIHNKHDNEIKSLIEEIQTMDQRSKSIQFEINQKQKILDIKCHEHNTTKEKEENLAIKLKEQNNHCKSLINQYKKVQIDFNDIQENETNLLTKIDDIKIETMIKSNEVKDLIKQTQVKSEKIKLLNNDIDSLSTQETLLKLDTDKHKNKLQETILDQQCLESSINEYNRKIENQEKYLDENKKSYNELSSQNKLYNEKISKLKFIIRKNQDSLEDSEFQNINMKKETEKSSHRYEDLKLLTIPHQPVTMPATVHAKVQSQDINAHLKLMEQRFNTDFFNITTDINKNDNCQIESYSVQQLQSFEESNVMLIQAIEKNLSIKADCIVNLTYNSSDAISEILINNLDDFSQDQLEKVMRPNVEKLLSQYNANNVGIKFKIRLMATGVVERVLITITAPLQYLKHHTITSTTSEIDSPQTESPIPSIDIEK